MDSKREFFAFAWSILALRSFIVVMRFTTRSDNDALRWLMSVDDPAGRLMRWGLQLFPFDFTVTHSLKRKHQVPDAVGRLQRDTEPAFPTDGNELPNFEDATALEVHTSSHLTLRVTPAADEHNEESDY